VKIAIINDTHFGVRNDNQVVADHHYKFYRKVFFPTLKEREITTIFHLGDLLDRRKYINFNTASRMLNEFFGPIKDQGITTHMVLGNHDTYFKNTNNLNGPELLAYSGESPPINIITDDATEMYGVLLVPWLTQENMEKNIQIIKNTKAKVCMGHFEIQGFEMMRGQVCDHGLNKKVFDKFHSVYSGHFHHPSKHGNIEYLGAPYEMTWADHNGRRGFHIFDTETLEVDFIENPYQIFHKVWYNDSEMTVEDINEMDLSELQNTFVKVIIQSKDNAYLFDLFMDKLQECGAHDVKVVEDILDLGDISEEELIDEAQDTQTILRTYIDNLDTRVDKAKLKSAMMDLYKEALSI